MCECVRAHVCACGDVHAWLSLCAHVCVHRGVCMCVCTQMSMHARMCVCVFVYMGDMCTYVRTCIEGLCVYMYHRKSRACILITWLLGLMISIFPTAETLHVQLSWVQ